MTDDLAYWLGLNQFPKFGPKSFLKLQNYFPSMKEAFFASKEELIKADISQKTAEQFTYLRKDISPERLLQQIKNHNIQVLTLADQNYPPLLKTLFDPPPLLYIKGKLPNSDILHISIVGSRKATQYGKQVAEEFASTLATRNAIIVSGLAYGIDETAHLATVKAKGITIGIIASGLAKLTARQIYLAQKITESGGTIISEFPLQTPALRQHFPIRNRIISGISQATIIVEATEKSGSLITAKSALEQNRDVFAIPGSIYSENSKGTNHLLRLGAIPTTSPNDILEHLQTEGNIPEQIPKPKAESKEEEFVLAHLSKNPTHIDDLAQKTKLNIGQINSTLSLMEIKGQAKHIGGKYYIIHSL